MLTKEETAEFMELAKPLVKFINERMHPHARAIISWDRAELVEDVYGAPIREFIRD